MPKRTAAQISSDRAVTAELEALRQARTASYAAQMREMQAAMEADATTAELEAIEARYAAEREAM